MVDPSGVGELTVVDNGKVCIEVVVGDRDVFMVVAEVVVCREMFLVRTGTVVFHWWVEKGLVTLAGSVTSWSPTVDRSDSGTVGRSQAGRLLTESSKLELLLLLDELLLPSTIEMVSELAALLSLLVAGEEGEEEEEEEEGKEDAFIVEEEDEEEEALDDDEEILVQAALDSSPKGFPTAGACSSVVSASMVRTDEKAACSLWPSPCVCSLCRPSQAAESLGMLGWSSPSASTGLHSAPTPAQAPVPVIIPVSAKTLPPAPARTPASVSVQTAVLASANTLPSGQARGPAPGLASVPSIASLSLAPVLSPVPGVAERLEGTVGSRGKTACLSDS